MFPELDTWTDLMMHNFDERQLRPLRRAPEDYERIAFLHLFDLILFDEVKKTLVAASGVVEKAINKFTQVRSSWFFAVHVYTLAFFFLAHHPCTAIALDTREDKGVDGEKAFPRVREKKRVRDMAKPPVLRQSYEGEERKYNALRTASDAYNSHLGPAGSSDHITTIDPALLHLEGYQPAQTRLYEPQPWAQDAELDHLLAPVRGWNAWLGSSSEAYPQRAPSHSPPPPPPAMHSLGLFRPRIARRIAKTVYGTNWQDWERARVRWHPGGSL